MESLLDIVAPAEQAEGTRSQILRWLKHVGETVSEHEPLIEIETDKVTVEIAAPASGVLREIVKDEQEEVAPGDLLGRIERAEAAAGDGEFRPEPRPAAAPADGDKTAAPVTVLGANLPNGPRASSSAGARLSPAVRRLLAERDLDPTAIEGSGEGGRITVDDVLAHDASANTLQPRRVSPTALPADAPAASRVVPHTAIRRRIAEHMVQSLLHTAPHVTSVFEADMTAVLAHRTRARAHFEQHGVPLTLTSYFLSAAVQAVRAVPEANSRWTDAALEVYDTINIGIATALAEGGLIVPVLRNVESMDLFAIAAGVNRLVTAAREARLQPADVRDGTLTVSNHGVSGSLLATPIVINQPQSAILGVGKLEKRAAVVTEQDEDRIVVRPKCYVTLTIDHRVMDGHAANRFLQMLVSTLETWPAAQ